VIDNVRVCNEEAGLSSILISAVLLAVAVIAQAQQPKKVPRIGYLSALDPASESFRSEPIRQALRELGYTERQNIATEYRYAEGKVDRYPIRIETTSEVVSIHCSRSPSVWQWRSI